MKNGDVIMQPTNAQNLRSINFGVGMSFLANGPWAHNEVRHTSAV
jgi:hypothetical protein